MRIQIPDNERGASAVEYGLIVVAIAALVVLVVFAFGKVVNELFDKTCDNVTTQVGTNSAC